MTHPVHTPEHAHDALCTVRGKTSRKLDYPVNGISLCQAFGDSEEAGLDGVVGPVRDDVALGNAVNERLLAWAETVGIYQGKREQFAAFGLGRLAMLVYPGTVDVDRLVLAACCMAASAAVDDHCVDAGTVQRLGLVQAAVQQVCLPSGYEHGHAQATHGDPVTRAMTSAMRMLAERATSAQVLRFGQEMVNSLLAKSVKAAWIANGTKPAVLEYLVHRQFNGFMPWMALIDVVGGFEVPDPLYRSPRVRKAMLLASGAAVIVHDLFSAEKGGVGLNLPTLFSAECLCPVSVAVGRSVEVLNDLLQNLDTVTATGDGDDDLDPSVRRFLTGLVAWMRGSRAWHSTSPRYHPGRLSTPKKGRNK